MCIRDRQKPKVVLDNIQENYSSSYSNVHRGLHWLSEQSTFKYEEVRKKAANFLGASNSNEIIYGSGATHLINLIANSWGRKFLKPDDEIIITSPPDLNVASIIVPVEEEEVVDEIDEDAEIEPEDMIAAFEGMALQPQARLAWALSLEAAPHHQVCDLVLKREGQWPAKRLAQGIKNLLGADDASDYKPSNIRTALEKGLDNHEGFHAWATMLGEDPSMLMAQSLGSRITRLLPAHWSKLKQDVMAIEEKAYEAGRQDSEADLHGFLNCEGSLCFKLERRTDEGLSLIHI